MAAIACLGWGSLIWDPRDLPLSSEWLEDGPLVNVEFARESNDGRVTIVLYPGARPVPSLWARMEATDVEQARHDLGSREGIPKRRWPELVGAWPQDSSECIDGLEEWARARELDAVVWTALSSNFEDGRPLGDQVIGHLRSLDGSKREKAEEYILRAPRQIDTELRRRIEEGLNWLPRDEG